MISSQQLTTFALLMLALNASGVVWGIWALVLGPLWGTVFFFIYMTGGMWLARVFHKRWP